MLIIKLLIRNFKRQFEIEPHFNLIENETHPISN